jgi:hypothetical protein
MRPARRLTGFRETRITAGEGPAARSLGTMDIGRISSRWGNTGVEVVVTLSPQAARSLRGQGDLTGQVDRILSTAVELGVRLEPMHPDVEDGPLAFAFRYEVADRASGERSARVFAACDGVEAAYWKPDAVPP